MIKKSLALCLVLTALYLNAGAQKSRYEKFGILPKTDAFTVIQKGDTATFIYPGCKVTTITSPSGDAGQAIIVEEGQRQIPLDIPAGYFIGISNNLLLIDAGTAVARELKLYDLRDTTEIFTTVYYDALILKGVKLVFEAETAKSNAPVCTADTQVAVERKSYDLKQRRLSASGKMHCKSVQ